MKLDSIKPGQELLDNNNKPVQAHGGSLFYEDGTYYFYGENKEYTIPNSDIWTYGIRAYSSLDLYNWTDLGLIIEPDLNDPSSPLNPKTAQMDRPHILYNQKNHKYVCWVKIMRHDGSQSMSILTADKFCGPYSIVNKDLKPLGMNSGDFALIEEEDKAYIAFEKVHSELIIADLNADYTDVSGKFTSHFPHPHPPYVREAPAYFKRGEKHYLFTSGTTGYFPNPSEVAISEKLHGHYTVLPNPFPEDSSNTSYHCQISSIFKVPNKKDLYIAIADRWLPNCMNLPYSFYKKVFEYGFSGREKEIPELFVEFNLSEADIQTIKQELDNTSASRYVWLPLRFVEPNQEYPLGKVEITWLDQWKIEDYE